MSTKIDSHEITALWQDPVTERMFQHAILLVPCGHTVSAESMQHILKTLSGITLTPIGASTHIHPPVCCLNCRKEVTMCVPNLAVRAIEPLLHRATANMMQASAKNTKEPYPVLPFVGKPAHFRDCTPSYMQQGYTAFIKSIKGETSEKFQKTQFASITPNSFLIEVAILEDATHPISITLICRTNYTDTFQEYLSASGLTLPTPFSGFFTAKSSRELCWAVRFLEKSGYFPKGALERIKQKINDLATTPLSPSSPAFSPFFSSSPSSTQTPLIAKIL